jgi:hypothetical protein
MEIDHRWSRTSIRRHSSSPQSQPPHTPSAHDFLLFAAIEYHAFETWEVNVHSGQTVVFSTKGMPHNSVIDVISEESALPVVAAQMVRRPHSQSPLRNLAKLKSGDEKGPYDIYMDSFSPDMPVCNVDFHSYAPEASKVTATLHELAGAYYRVVQFIKNPTSPGSRSLKEQLVVPHRVACISIGQSLWIAIFGGVTLDRGRLTMQNLPGKWQMKDVSADEAYITRVEGTLDAMEQHINKTSNFHIAYSGGLARHSAHPFLAAGLFGQVVVCYFLSVGTSAGVWTSVALANSLFAGKLTDWHSMFHGKTPLEEEPGMKLCVPGSKELMAIATFDRSTPREIRLRPGLFLNSLGLIAAILGATFQQQTRSALNFRPFVPTPAWVGYTSVGLCIFVSLLITMTLAYQQMRERTWWNTSEVPLRWTVCTSLLVSFAVSGLAVYLLRYNLTNYWPVLDALTWLSGLPLGIWENGRLFSADSNTLQLVLLNRWIMGAVASAVGSA